MPPKRPQNDALRQMNRKYFPFLILETPGPGSYQPPSDFGYLELYKNSPRTSQSPRSTRPSRNGPASSFMPGVGGVRDFAGGRNSISKMAQTQDGFSRAGSNQYPKFSRLSQGEVNNGTTTP